MKLLIIGGTVFLGRHLIEAALAKGHEVTMFNRGKRNPELFPEVERLQGDRDGNLEALKGRRWDAVIDTCGYVPRIVTQSAELLAGAVDHYTFISTISVYPDTAEPGTDENTPVRTIEDTETETIDGRTYGALKALCEQAVERALPGRTLIVRPGLIVGPHDPTDRFTYWPERLARGGEVLAPGTPEGPVQVIDVRDLAEWTIRMVEARTTGVFNAVGPDSRLTMAEVLRTCKEVTGSDAAFTWVPESFLLEQKVGAFVEMPLWLPESHAGLDMVNPAKAIAAGLTYRPLADTVRATLVWSAGRPAGSERRAGLKPERERELLEAWHARQGA